MTGTYVLEIPDLHQVLRQEDVEKWEIFLTSNGKGQEKISWPLSFADNTFVFHNSLPLNKQIESVKIDFTDNQVTFYKGHIDSESFKELLELVLSKMYIHINQNQMHFLVSSSNYSSQKSTSLKK